MRLGVWVSSFMLFSAVVGAHADTLTPVRSSGESFDGSGTLYVSTGANGQGGYSIVSVEGPGVTGLVPVHGFGLNDNLLFLNQAQLLDGFGFAFTDLNGESPYTVDLYYDSDLDSYAVKVLDSQGDTTVLPGTFSVDQPTGAVAHTAVRQLAAMPASGVQAVNFSFAAALPEASGVTPEPASYALMGTGLLGLAGLVRSRRRK